ncbi:MAG: hypothetical protein O6939_10050, partial [Bacteroidetes bacterium]|nr:hypothetical protein [Bacteroidota bacterium]
IPVGSKCWIRWGFRSELERPLLARKQPFRLLHALAQLFLDDHQDLKSIFAYLKWIKWITVP